MRRKSILLAVFILLVSEWALAQGIQYEYGHLSPDDLTMSVYERDSSAEAVMLLNYADYYQHARRLLQVRVHQRIKILTTEGLAWGNHKIKYLREGGKPRDMRMTTYSYEDGEVVTIEAKEENISDEKLDNEYGLMTVSMPRVRVGSIVEFTYIYTVSESTSIPDWNWQLNIPVRFSELIIDMGAGGMTRNAYRIRGSLQPQEPAEKKHAFHYFMRDIPALADEPYVFCRDNYRSSFLFEGRDNRGWEGIVYTLVNAAWFGDTFKFNNDLKRVFPEDSNWGPNERSIREIFNFVRDHFEWDEYISALPSERPRNTWNEGRGHSGEINSVLLNMLLVNDIEAYPLLISTAGHGRIDNSFPMFTQFNNLIVYAIIGEKGYLLDATEKSRPFNVLPEYCLNGYGLIIDKKSAGWVDLTLNKEQQQENATVEFHFDENGKIRGKAEFVFRSLAAAYYRDILLKEKEEGLKENFKELIGENIITDLKIENLNDPSKPLGLNIAFVSEETLFEGESTLFINPLLIKTFRINPLKDKSRELPVEFAAPMINTSLFRFRIPDGYEMEELPQSKSMRLPNGDAGYLYSASVVNGYLEVVVRFNIQRLLFQPEVYPALKSFFDLLVEKQEEQVVFIRK
jgi:hypothetical protein